MGRIFARVRNTAAEPAKRLLDRRYALAADLVELDARVSVIQTALREAEATRARSIGSETSDEGGVSALRAAAADAKRLATECARAIEVLSQDLILIRRDIDAIADRSK